MSNKEKDAKKGREVIPGSTSGSLFSFDEIDRFFDDFLSRRWPRPLDFNFSAGFDRGFPKVDILDHDNEIVFQAALPGVKKEDLDVTINNQTITIRTSIKEEKTKKKASIFAARSREENFNAPPCLIMSMMPMQKHLSKTEF
jgi:HSP20 family protein